MTHIIRKHKRSLWRGGYLVEHPILFSAPMVRAILDGRKTQTRRIITRRNSYIDGGPAYARIWDGLRFDDAWVDRGPSPAGNPGPYLKVPRVLTENGKMVDEFVHRIYSRIQVGDVLWVREGFRYVDASKAVVMYRADHKYGGTFKWKPSIHMPRRASRVKLEVTAVHPEHVQSIEERDIRAEGLRNEREFIDLWNSLNEKRGFGWDLNPWIRSIAFRRVK